ncbi:hypothetical protein [Methylophilus methylotrophus]|uniref:hypothetical protein n=1 Tax=Methylophilus methylotrophus TaxID=17 RepID=UPI00036E1D46|nr:hypothetical protein [Methylophilus methylotrophus]
MSRLISVFAYLVLAQADKFMQIGPSESLVISILFVLPIALIEQAIECYHDQLA